MISLHCFVFLISTYWKASPLWAWNCRKALTYTAARKDTQRGRFPFKMFFLHKILTRSFFKIVKSILTQPIKKRRTEKLWCMKFGETLQKANLFEAGAANSNSEQKFQTWPKLQFNIDIYWNKTFSRYNSSTLEPSRFCFNLNMGWAKLNSIYTTILNWKKHIFATFF